MINGFYSAASSLMAQQTNLNTIANNVANSNTTAFKPQQVSFASLLYNEVNGGAGHEISTGHGSKVQKTSLDLTQGGLNSTGMEMDCAIMGEGFFSIENRKDGTVTYTRDGSFSISVEAKGAYLVNGQGNYVLDGQGKHIEIKEKFELDKIGVVNFKNNYGLQVIGGNQFKETKESGKPDTLKDPDVKSGFLENSGVQLSQEMVKMIEASKGFSFSSKVVQTADEMEKIINQLR